MDLDKLRVGCSGWSYKDWAGVFYPKGLAAKDYLAYYSKVFNCVEVDSSFYRVPSQFMVNQWRNNTPADFVFSPKLPKKITHEQKLKGSESNLVYFYSVLGKLKDKLGPIAIQLPPSVKLSTHQETMKEFISQLSPEFKHAVEFRHRSWFTPEVYSLLRKNNIAMVWSLNQYVETPPEVTADFVYVRMVGDREITEFTGVQKDRSDDMKRWAESVKDNAGKFESGYVFFNNHFAGFSPESANEFRRLLGLMEMDWKAQETQQQTLFGS
ncbi:MAG: DUF72 domain-containing protein [Nitrososphaerota archaeon]|nr:DUF72 domain-containing protein [Nitrososphaerota archaeon]MDG6983178.1 DUF72 domain-containing protein [Nitrososphaerota archaeon]